MKTCGIVINRSIATTSASRGWIHKWPRFKRWQEMEKERNENIMSKMRQKNFIKLPTGLYITPEKPEDIEPKKATADQTRKDTGALPFELMTWHTQMRYVDHSFDNIKRYNRYTNFQHMQYDQRVIPERTLFLGPDLAAAHFIVHRGGAVKFIGDDAWYKKDKNNRYSLPGRKVDNLYVEAVDASGTSLMFEGLENLENLEHLRLLRVASCEYIDDWALSRIGGLLPNLEMLDLSGCHRISEKGLMGLKQLKKLKYLRLEGLDFKDIGKASLLLEESIPNLKVLGVDFEKELKHIEAENRLLENPNIVQDARGNAFLEDENSRLFLVLGNINEKAVTDDNDNPIMTSTIRREIPKIDDEEFDKIDKLSGGKLRHLLVGSPSGYEWTETTERILEHEAKWKSKEGIVIDPKMLPKSQRKEFELEKTPSKLEEAKRRFLEEWPSPRTEEEDEEESRKKLQQINAN